MESTNIIDLDVLGPITDECVKYLADKLAQVCVKNTILFFIGDKARGDFGWSHIKLVPYIEKGLIPRNDLRVSIIEDENLVFLSACEWLCGVFYSGQILDSEHVSLHMGFVNSLSSFGDYKSGKETWNDAPSPLKEIFNILDTAALKNEDVRVHVLAEPSHYPTIELDAVFVERSVKITVGCFSYINDSFFMKEIMGKEFKHLILLATSDFEDTVFELVKFFLENDDYLVREVVGEDEINFQVKYLFSNETLEKVNQLNYDQVISLLLFADSFDIKPLITALFVVAISKHANKDNLKILSIILKEIESKRIPSPKILVK